MPQEISVRIDGELCRASEGQTILDVARANKKYIPTLCFLEGLTPSGSCRLCLVEVAGVGRLLPACTTPIQNGMSVNTNSEKLLRHRQMAMEFLLLERNHYCSVCVCNNHCELQAMATRLGVTHVRFPYNYPRLPVDVSHERYVLDHNRCILVYALRESVRGGGGRQCLGHQRPGHQLAPGGGTRPAVGRIKVLHQVRQVRAGVPDRRIG